MWWFGSKKPVMSPTLRSFSTEPCEKQGTGNVSKLETERSGILMTSFATGCLCTCLGLYGIFASMSGAQQD